MRDEKDIRTKIGEDIDRRDQHVNVLASKYTELTTKRNELHSSTAQLTAELQDLQKKKQELQELESTVSLELAKLAARAVDLCQEQQEYYLNELLAAAIALGKLGGMYYCLGFENSDIVSMLSDKYWLGLADKPTGWQGPDTETSK